MITITRTALLALALILPGCVTHPINPVIDRGDAAGVRALLASGDSPNQRLFSDWTPMHTVAKTGRVDILRDLLQWGGEVDIRGANVAATPLYVAAEYGHPEIMKALIAAGATIDATTSGGNTPLQRAAESGCGACVEVLLAAGANPRAGTGLPPLHLAVKQGHAGVVGFLLDAGESVNSREAGIGATPLYIAAEWGQVNIAMLLVDRKADIHAKTTGGFTALMRAVDSGSRSITELLLARGANVNDRGGDWTPLLLASYNGNQEMMQLLRNAGADNGVRRQDGRGVNDIFNLRAYELEQQRVAELQRQREAADRKRQQEAGGFQWGKLIAMTAAAAPLAIEGVDSQVQLEVFSGIVQDSMSGVQGMSNLQTAADNASARFQSGSGAPAGGGGAGTYPPRPNTLAGHPACAGYTVDNYKEHFAANRNGPDVQLHSLCAGAYNYYWMYLNAIRQGYSQPDSDRTYSAFQDAARVATDFYAKAR